MYIFSCYSIPNWSGMLDGTWPLKCDYVDYFFTKLGQTSTEFPKHLYL